MNSATDSAVTTRNAKQGGQLRSGNPGNKGGRGAPASAIREICRESFAARVGFLQRLADGKIKQEIATREGIVKVAASPADRVRAMDMLGKYGALQVMTVEEPDRPEQSGELLMARVLGMVGRALLAAPSASRAAVLAELSAIEVAPEGEV